MKTTTHGRKANDAMNRNTAWRQVIVSAVVVVVLVLLAWWLAF